MKSLSILTLGIAGITVTIDLVFSLCTRRACRCSPVRAKTTCQLEPHFPFHPFVRMIS